MRTSFLVLLVYLFLFFACSSDTATDDVSSGQDPIENPVSSTLYFPPVASDEWKTIDPSELNWNTAEEAMLQAFLEEKETKAFIVLKEGKIALEWYFDDHNRNTNWYWASAGKTLTAFSVGMAQEEGLLDINAKTSDYLGTGWTSLEPDKEDLITVWHQLTMSSGLNDLQFDCVTPDCLEYLADAGTRWAYHNGPYTLLQQVVTNASGQEWASYFNNNLRDPIGMDGFWLSTNGTNNVFFSTARSMARFGLLNLNNGEWNGDTILGDEVYNSTMKDTSQELNEAYGYLWWLNGKSTYRAPSLQIEFNGELIPNAPDDTYAGLGKNDQKLYIVPSKGLVIVRLGEDAGENLLGPSSFDNALWEKLDAYLN